MTDINTNYIHHVTEEQYEEAVEYLLFGTLDPQDTMSPSAISRFQRRWRDAEVRFIEEEPTLFVDNKEVILFTEIENVLSKLYDDPSSGGNLGRDKFYNRVRNLYVGITRADVERFIQNDETHQLHRRITKKMKVVRPLAVPSSPMIRWQMDLIDQGDKLVHENLGYRYVLTVVDIFSKYAWARRLKSKEAQEVVMALTGILQEEGSPSIIQSDNGSEFRNQWMTQLAHLYEFKQVFSAPYRPQSQGAVERFNQTLKRMLYSHMTRYKTKVWADVLQSSLVNYNNNVHLSTGYTPTYLHTSGEQVEFAKVQSKMERRNKKWLEQYKQEFKPLRVGNPVRVSNLVFKDYRRKSALSIKSYKPNWSREIYTVVSISQPKYEWQNPQYTVEDPQGNRLRVFRDNLQLLPSYNPRVSILQSRPLYEDFFYREQAREQAREARGAYIDPPVDSFHLTEEARRRRRPSTMLSGYYL